MWFRVILVCFVLSHTVSAYAVPSTSIPDTPAGRVLRGWLDAVNDGGQEKLETFVDTFWPNGNVGDLALPSYKAGGFDLLGVDRSERLQIVATLRSKSDHGEFVIHIDVREEDTPLIVHLRVFAVPASPKYKAEEVKLDAAERDHVIDGAVRLLDEFYVYPEIARKMEVEVRTRQQSHAYDDIFDPNEFAEKLTEDLHRVSADKHLGVGFQYEKLPMDVPEGHAPDDKRFRGQMAIAHCGFEKVEHLPSNIGYVKFNIFVDPAICGPTATETMDSIADSDAIIIDMRENSGGHPKMVAFMASYLFAERTHLNDLYNRRENSTEEYWTQPDVPGKKFINKPVFVLTSARTFSGAEEFSYDLKNLKRATLVGETTAGGAHPTWTHRIDDHFYIAVPFARAINPITKTDWEGKGVEPDVKVPAENALDDARKMAVQRDQRR